jgi:uncharacterized membrane protein YebE (DUF533 family)
MKTLARMAVTVAVAKGASEVMKNRQRGGAALGGGLGGLLGSLGGSGGLSGILGGLGAGTGVAPGSTPRSTSGSVLGGGTAGGASGGLGGLLESLGGGRGLSQGGLGSLLGGLAGGAGLLGGLGGAVQKAPEQSSDSFGAVLNSQFDETPKPAIQPSRDQEAVAGLMIAAMIQAAKSDGTFDEAEKEKLLSHLGELDAEDTAYVRERMKAPVDIDALVADTPEGMGAQIYTMSVMAIDLDTSAEAKYLDKLAKAYGMTPAEVNEIHDQLGVPSLYT